MGAEKTRTLGLAPGRWPETHAVQTDQAELPLPHRGPEDVAPCNLSRCKPGRSRMQRNQLRLAGLPFPGTVEGLNSLMSEIWGASLGSRGDLPAARP